MTIFCICSVYVVITTKNKEREHESANCKMSDQTNERTTKFFWFARHRWVEKCAIPRSQKEKYLIINIKRVRSSSRKAVASNSLFLSFCRFLLRYFIVFFMFVLMLLYILFMHFALFYSVFCVCGPVFILVLCILKYKRKRVYAHVNILELHIKSVTKLYPNTVGTDTAKTRRNKKFYTVKRTFVPIFYFFVIFYDRCFTKI